MSSRKVTSIAVAGGKPPLQLVELNGMLFSSTIHGADPETGAIGSEPEKQFEVAFRNLQRLIEKAGASTEELGLVTVGIPDQSYRAYINKPWLATFPDEQLRPARKTNQYPLPDGAQVQLQVIGVAGQRPKPLEIPGFAHRDPLPAGVRIGDVVFSSVVTPTDPATGQQVEDPEGQIRQAFRNLEALLQDAGGTWDDVIHVYAFLADRPVHQRLLDKVWPEIFPIHGQCPARKAVQYDELKSRAAIVQLQMVAVVGQGQRRDFLLPDVPVHDTGTMGAAIGKLLWSCGLAGNPHGKLGSLEEQAEWACRHMRTIAELAGGSADNIGQATIMVRQYEDAPTVMKYWRELFPDPADEPAHHTVAFGLNPQNNERVQFHIVAAY